MPRLFTGLKPPPDVTERLASLRGGLPGARWVETSDYHVTLRFLGDVDDATAREFDAMLAEAAPRGALTLRLEGVASFGGDRPRALFAKVAENRALRELQAEHERIARAVGLKAETRRYTPHVTLARLRGVSAGDVAATLAGIGAVPALTFTAEEALLYSAKESVGGGPYRVEASYPLG
ncbi:MAG TPA: RNA 2',3'-cyclic phosphodiesterase [Beijerinckiaceae bacterium]|jgi:2'-5' RNA ligase